MSTTSLATIFQVCKWIWNTLFHQCIAVVAIYAIWIPVANFTNPFSWHVILCSLGVVPLMSEALILFSSDNVWTQDIQREKKYWIHGILIFIGAFFIITGIGLEINRKVNMNAAHFTSPHAILGLLTMIFLIFALCCAPLAFGTLELIKCSGSPIWFKLIHNSLGQVGYILSIVCLCLGFYTDWFVSYTSENSRGAATVAVVIAAVWCLIFSFKSTFHQIKAIFVY